MTYNTEDQLINKTGVCSFCGHFTFGFTSWCFDKNLMCHPCSCETLTPTAHYERTGLANPRYRIKCMRKLLGLSHYG